MAKYKKGQSGNINGRPKEPKEVKGVKELTKHNLMIIMNKYMYKPRKELEALFKDGSLVMAEEMVVSLMISASKSADVSIYEMFLDRMIGKPKIIVDSHNFDETKDKGTTESEKILLKILLDQKSEDLSKVYVAQGLLKKDD